ncbi:MAG: DUF4349 domain-containing protein [Bacteroidetes bacterium]|nr:DUF4349 domain-containing protein [Bacteroidota bacterium]
MKMKCLYMAMVMLLFACQSKNENEELAMESMMDVSLPAACMTLAPPPPLVEMVKFTPPVIKDDAVEEEVKASKANATKKIIKDGNISIKVKAVEIAKQRMDSVLKKFDAYYELEKFRNYENRTSYDLKIRIPSNQFDSFLKATEKGEGEIMSKAINARDVTEEYTDTEVRLESKRLFRKRYNELLNKAGKVVDILAIEENIRLLQEEIESGEGRLKFLNDQVAYSTLEVTLFKLKETAIVEVKKETFGQLMKASIGSGWSSVIDFLLWSIKQWPWVVVILTFIFVLKIFLKRRKKAV